MGIGKRLGGSYDDDTYDEEFLGFGQVVLLGVYMLCVCLSVCVCGWGCRWTMRGSGGWWTMREAGRYVCVCV